MQQDEVEPDEPTTQHTYRNRSFKRVRGRTLSVRVPNLAMVAAPLDLGAARYSLSGPGKPHEVRMLRRGYTLMNRELRGCKFRSVCLGNPRMMSSGSRLAYCSLALI